MTLPEQAQIEKNLRTMEITLDDRVAAEFLTPDDLRQWFELTGKIREQGGLNRDDVPEYQRLQQTILDGNDRKSI